MWGMVLGLVIGLAWRGLLALAPRIGWDEAGLSSFGDWVTREVLDPFGQIFLRLLFFVIVPLVFASLAAGVVQLGRLDRLGPLAGRTFALFGLNMAIGVGLGLLMMNVLQPGRQIDDATRERIVAAEQQATAAQIQKAHEREGFTFATAVEMFMPRNILAAVVGQSTARIGDVLPLIVFALLVGAAGTTLAEPQRLRLFDALEITTRLMTRIVHWALLLAPYAVAALLCSVVVKFGIGYLRGFGLFLGGVLAAMALHLFGTMGLLLRLFTRRSPRQFFRAVRTILVTAFSTSSSNATLPTSIEVARDELGVSASTAGFVLPLGATMNMSGTALYEGCVVLFIAQVYGIDLSLGQQVTLLLLAVLSAVAVAGIPGASLPLIIGLLASFGLPPEGIALILGLDRVLDMARTTLNVGADVVTACIVDEHMGGATAPGPSLPPQ